RRQSIHVVDFTVGGTPSVEEIPVPGCYSSFVVRLVIDRHIPFAASEIRAAKLILSAALGNRIANLDDSRAQSLGFIDGARCLAHRAGTKRCNESRNDHDPAWEAVDDA